MASQACERSGGGGSVDTTATTRRQLSTSVQEIKRGPPLRPRAQVTEVDEERGRLMLSSKAAAAAERASAYEVRPCAHPLCLPPHPSPCLPARPPACRATPAVVLLPAPLPPCVPGRHLQFCCLGARVAAVGEDGNRERNQGRPGAALLSRPPAHLCFFKLLHSGGRKQLPSPAWLCNEETVGLYTRWLF